MYSVENQADSPFRIMSKRDIMLSLEELNTTRYKARWLTWLSVEELFNHPN